MSWDPTQEQQQSGPWPNQDQSGAADPQYEYPPYTPPPVGPYGAPPQYPYGGFMPPPPPMYGYAPGPPATPLPLGKAIAQLPGQYLKVTTRPGARSFAEEMGKAEWGIVWVQLIGYAGIAGVLSFLRTQLYPVVIPNTNNALSPQAIHAIQQFATYSTGFGAFVGVLAGFFIAQGIYFGLAKAFKGQGSFLAQTYTSLLYLVPIGIISSLLTLLPIAGGLISGALSIYGLVLQAFAIMAVHRLSGGKATGVILIPIGVVVLLACCALVALVAALAPSIRPQ